MNQKQLALLLEKYLKGLCTADERAIIDQWYDKQDHSLNTREMPSLQKREAMKRRILQNILENMEKDGRVLVPVRRSIYRRLVLPLVASAAILLFIFRIAFTIHNTKNEAEQRIVQKEMVNHSKNMLKQVLPDSSIVWLSPQAKLRFPEKFTGDVRSITMEGECFFEIAKDPAHPFLIYSEHFITKVLGTSFKVSDKSGSPTALVTVLTGKVSVKPSGKGLAALTKTKAMADEITLSPQQRVTLDPREKKIYQEKGVDLNELQMYKHISLLFENAKLEHIVKVLNENFQADIRFVDQSLKDKVMDADLTDLNLPEILSVLKTSLQLDYEINGQHVVLRNNN